MIEVTGNLWTYPADVRVITTNGTVKKNGECVMGRGCALEAKQKFQFVAELLGKKLLESGNHVHYIGTPSDKLFSFPVKHEWHQKADGKLIKRSADELLAAIDELEAKLERELFVVMPRPGCGNGGLHWTDVKKVLAPMLDDRFHVITFEHKTHYFNHNEV